MANDLVNLLSPVPPEILRQCPQPRGSIATLSQEETFVVFAEIAYLASKSDYNYVSEITKNLGKYQLSANSLILLGYVKPNSLTSELSDPDRWIQGGARPGTLTKFLGDQDLQEEAMFSLMEIIASELKNQNLINTETSKEVIAGLLVLSHFVGVTTAKRYYVSNANIRDAYNIAASTYFNNGVNAVKNLTATVVAMTRSRNIVGA